MKPRKRVHTQHPSQQDALAIAFASAFAFALAFALASAFAFAFALAIAFAFAFAFAFALALASAFAIAFAPAFAFALASASASAFALASALASASAFALASASASAFALAVALAFASALALASALASASASAFASAFAPAPSLDALSCAHGARLRRGRCPMSRPFSPLLPALLSALTIELFSSACAPRGDEARAFGQTSFLSAPPGRSGGRGDAIDATGGGEGGPLGAPMTPSGAAGIAPPRAIEETDLYRVVGDRLYAVSEDWGFIYGEGDEFVNRGAADGTVGTGVGTVNGPDLVVSSVHFGLRGVHTVGGLRWSGWGGIFNVTASSILLARPLVDATSPAPRTGLQVLDISDPAGAILKRGELVVDGQVQGFGPDNGRFNLDFADGRIARVLGCGGLYCGESGIGSVLSIADFTNPDAPSLLSRTAVSISGWTPTARFDGARLFLSPNDAWNATSATTPIEVWDLTDPTNPKLLAAPERKGWGWLLDVQDDTAIVTSGWGAMGVGLYHLGDGAPRYSRTVRTRSWGTNAIERPGDDLFLASGHWGVQRISL